MGQGRRGGRATATKGHVETGGVQSRGAPHKQRYSSVNLAQV